MPLSSSLLLLGLLAGPTVAAPPGAPEAPRPNVLIVVLDDVGTDRVAAYGEAGDPGRTPVMDTLAAQGVLMRNAWSAPVCSPTRVQLITGRYGFRSGIGATIPFDNTGQVLGSGGPAGIAEHEVSLGWIARRAGYRTAAIGKWHMANITSGGYDHPVLLGFERHVGHIGVSGYWDWTKNIADASGNVQVSEPGYVTSVNVDDTLAVIEEFGDDPWLVYLALTTAHEPFHVPPLELLSAETAAAVTQPDPPLAEQHRAMVEAADTEIGRLLAGIRPVVLEHTLVLLIGDNGTQGDALEAPTVNKGAKGAMVEGGVNVPFLIAGAGVQQPGREVPHLTHAVDVFATALDVIGAPPQPQLVDGRSLAPVLADPGASPAHRWVYTERFEPNGFGPKQLLKRAVRDARYKLIRVDAPGSSLRLFDLVEDPGEELDLLDGPLDAGQQAAFERLLAILETHGP